MSLEPDEPNPYSLTEVDGESEGKRASGAQPVAAMFAIFTVLRGGLMASMKLSALEATRDDAFPVRMIGSIIAAILACLAWSSLGSSSERFSSHKRGYIALAAAGLLFVVSLLII